MKINRFIGDLQRFGFTPKDIICRITHFKTEYPKVLIISVPKAGTHLIERALILHEGFYRRLLPTLNGDNIKKYGGMDRIFKVLKPSQVLVSHLHYSPELEEKIIKNNIKCFFIIRDPRDIIISRTHYIYNTPKHYYYQAFRKIETFEERLQTVIQENENQLVSVAATLAKFSGWLHSCAKVVKFEDLSLSNGKDAQIQSISDMYAYLGVELSEREMGYITHNLRSTASPTFRKGKSGQWKNHFTDADLKRLNPALIQWIQKYGYEVESV